MTAFDALCWSAAALLGLMTCGTLVSGVLFLWIVFWAARDSLKRRNEFIRDLEKGK